MRGAGEVKWEGRYFSAQMSCVCIAVSHSSSPKQEVPMYGAYATIQLSATIKYCCCGDGGWTSGRMSLFFVPVLHYTLLSVCPLTLSKIAVLLRVEFTLDPLFAPSDTPSLAPSFLPFALCHQSPTVSKNSSIVIVTDLSRFSGPPLFFFETQEAASHALFICFACLFWLFHSTSQLYQHCSVCLLIIYPCKSKPF